MNGGIGLAGALFIAFLVLKLCGVITWAWIWVTVPLWGGFALGLLMTLVALVAGAIVTRRVKKGMW